MGNFIWPEWMPLPQDAPPPSSPPPDPRVAREEKIANDTRVEQALNRFIAARQGALFDAPDAFYRTQGEDAIHAALVTRKTLEQLRNTLLDGLANVYQRKRLGNALDAQMQLTRNGVARHVAEQSLAWQRGVAQDRIALLAREAAHHHNDTALIDALGHAAATAARAHSRVGDGPPGGEAEDAAAATARSGVLGAAIQARLDRGDMAGANTLLTQMRDQLDPAHAAPLQGQIDTAETDAWEDAPELPTSSQREPAIASTSTHSASANDGEILSDASPESILDGQRYAQNGWRPPTRRIGPGGRDLTPREETRWDFFELHRAELEKLEPGNPRLSYAAPSGWVPTQRHVDEMAREASQARARAVPRSRSEEATESYRDSGLSASELVRGSVPNGIQGRTGKAELESRLALTRSQQAAVNFSAGRRYEEETNSQLEQDRLEVGPQLTLETSSGKRTRMDFVTRDPTSGEIRCIECKASETAPLFNPDKQL